jgi:hypothetical protein
VPQKHARRRITDDPWDLLKDVTSRLASAPKASGAGPGLGDATASSWSLFLVCPPGSSLNSARFSTISIVTKKNWSRTRLKFRRTIVHQLRLGIRPIVLIAFFLSSAGNWGFALPGNGHNLSGTRAATGTLAVEVQPNPVNFGRVVVGQKNSQTMRLTNAGKTSLTVTQVQLIGHGYGVTGLSLPLTLAAGKSTTFTLSFQALWAGNITGTLTITCKGELLPTIINLDGAGITAALKLTPNPTSLSFGSVTVGSTVTKDVKLTNVGNTNVDIKTVSVSGAGFTASGGVNVILTPTQSTSVAVSFDPKVAGSVAGKLSVGSNAPALAIALSAQGSAGTKQRTVLLDWSPNTSGVEGYNIYRGTASGGPYSRLNGTPDAGTSYSDSTVASGKSYYYVVTAVGTDQVESAYSQQVSATVPNP